MNIPHRSNGDCSNYWGISVHIHYKIIGKGGEARNSVGQQHDIQYSC